MAKGFNEREKEAIRQKLMDAAEVCWGRYGLRKTSVDELVAMANISKGSFYLFYPSKEHLFMDTFDRIDTRTKERLFAMLANSGSDKKEILTGVIRFLIKEVKKTPWMLNMSKGDLELLIRKLPPERVAKHLNSDDDAAVELMKYLDIRPDADPKLVSGVFRAIFLMLLHSDEIGEDIMDDVIDYMIDAVIGKMFSNEGSKG
ncbi:MAG TPA: TetR/AcrR family transcriptional regulator [Clostridia bacterium]|nr:TetR/AcrR family transcriptional regulator [Clostridia bacterium]